MLKSKQYEKAQQELGDNTPFIAKLQKVIKLADKSEFGWETVNENLDDGLISDDEDSKRKRQRGELPKKLRDVQFYKTERSLKCQLIILIRRKLIVTTSSKIPASLLRAQNVSYSRTNPINDICYKCGKMGTGQNTAQSSNSEFHEDQFNPITYRGEGLFGLDHKIIANNSKTAQ